MCRVAHDSQVDGASPVSVTCAEKISEMRQRADEESVEKPVAVVSLISQLIHETGGR